ncbi:MAG: hypothetical protein Q8N60_05745 [Candidatus Diapherotrites archaeon]|nr:hypothetical protein [Candidatus Diapherotrites archaeon]
MSWRDVTANLWKVCVFLLAVAIAVYVIIEFKIWSESFTGYFFKIGNWEMLIFVFLVATAVSMVLGKLMRWEARAITKPRRRK